LKAVKTDNVISRSRSRSPSDCGVRFVRNPVRRGRPSKKEAEIRDSG